MPKNGFFGSKSLKIAKRWGWSSRPPLRLNDYENIWNPAPIEITNWCRWLGIFVQNETYIL